MYVCIVCISMYILLCVLPSLNKGFTYLLTIVED